MEESPTPTVFKTITGKPWQVVLRDEWQAQPPKWTASLDLPIQKVFCMPTHKDRCYNITDCIKELHYLQSRHMKGPSCPDIKYNFVIGSDGSLYEGRGWTALPGLPVDFKSHMYSSILVGFTGRFAMNTSNPEYSCPIPKIMWLAYDQLIKMGVEQGYLDPNYVMYEL